MEMVVREPGTYRTRTGKLVHLRPTPEGLIVLEAEDDQYGRLGGDESELTKLSDDPDWPDLGPRFGDPTLFTD
jgi:hypothetical protein